MLLYLVRHGETDWNYSRRIQGSTDIPLNETGRGQARVTGQLLATRHWDAIVASPLSRAFETATIIADEAGLASPTTLAAVVERNYGDAEGLTDAELRSLFPGDAPVPGRETREEVVARALPALLELAESRPGQSVIVVCHGGVIRSILEAVDPDNAHPAITNGSVHSLEYIDGSFRLIAFDDPIEVQSLAVGTDDLDEQNPAEAREHA